VGALPTPSATLTINQKGEHIMTTIVQFIPQWLRARRQRSTPRQIPDVNKKDRQVLPTLPKQERPPVSWQDDSSPAGYRVLWRL